MSLWRILERAASEFGARTAVVEGARAFTYAELYGRVSSLASSLARCGVGSGDRIAILAWNDLEFLESYFAAAGLGAILCPLNVRLSAAEIEEILVDAECCWLVVDARLEALAREIVDRRTPLQTFVWFGATAPRSGTSIAILEYEELIAGGSRFTARSVRPDDVAHLYYTSGTTGRAKGVPLSHRNVETHAIAAARELSLREDDVWGHIAPMFHLADAWATFAITHVGGRHAMLPKFGTVEALDFLARARVTVTNLIPTMLNLMVKHPHAAEVDCSAMRLVLSGGAPIAPETVRAIVERFRCEYVQTYGMTETSPYLTLSLLHEHLRSLPEPEQMRYRCKTGRPFATIELRVVGESGADVPRDDATVGEVWVRGPTVTAGYWNRPEETARAFRDGWLMTGDLAVIDAEGYVNIVDRKKDVILTGGENVYTTEVENVLHAHPAVLEAAVFGVPDPVYGESVRAAIVLRTGSSATAADLQSFCRTKLGGYKVPRDLVFLAELPRTGSGKIAKRFLRDRHAPSSGSGETT